jgi:lipopolysaccharide transport system permease protein
MAIFTVIFGTFARIPSGNVPYSIFAYVALVPWNYVSQALSRSSEGIVANRNLVTKVYFPRLVIPLSTVLAPLVDFALSFIVLLCLMVVLGIAPSWRVVFLPAFMLLAILAALSVCLWFSAANVKYRDIRYVVPFVIQVWMYASPVVYSTTIVPERFRFIYGLNPLTGIIDGFRWALLGSAMPDLGMLAMSAAVVLALLVGAWPILLTWKIVLRMSSDE